MKPCLSYTESPITMWKGLNFSTCPSGFLLPSSEYLGAVGRCRTLHCRASTYACSRKFCSLLSTVGTTNNSAYWLGMIPAVVGDILKSMSSIGGPSGNAYRSLSYHSECSRTSSPLELETSCGTHSRRLAEPKGGDRQFIWRTTKDRFIDFCLTPEEESRLKLCHDRITASSWSSVTPEEVDDCLLTQEKREKALRRPFLQQLRSFWCYVLSPRGLEEDGRRLFRTVIPCYEDTMLTAKYFGIEQSDFNSRIYFLLVHVWSLHCALQKAGLETLKIKLWDALWDFLTNILIEEGVSEFRIPAVLREQQFTSLGFCVSLDEAFEDESAFPAGQLAHRLWVTVFGAKEKSRDCPELIALTTYSLRARSFALMLPRDALARGAFHWPAWPPKAFRK